MVVTIRACLWQEACGVNCMCLEAGGISILNGWIIVVGQWRGPRPGLRDTVGVQDVGMERFSKHAVIAHVHQFQCCAQHCYQGANLIYTYLCRQRFHACCKAAKDQGG